MAFAGVYNLTFYYAAQANVPLTSCYGNFYWNDVPITATIMPTTTSFVKFTMNVTGRAGNNSFTMEGAGINDNYGLGIKNVSLINSAGTNLIVNGDFEKPSGIIYYKFYPSIQGWTSNTNEI